MSRSSFFILIFLAFLLSRGDSLNIDALKILSWNIGSNYCRAGQSWPNCDSYIVTSVNKIIEVGNNYDVLCLQEMPKYYRSQQKAVADKLINDLALKYRFSVFRKEASDIAILSKIPIEEMGQIDLSDNFGAQRVQFTLRGKKYQVVNIQNPKPEVVPDINTRIEDLGKTIRWMNQSQNAGDINILAGNFNMEYPDLRTALRNNNPFGYTSVPDFICSNDFDCIFCWGEKGLRVPFSLPKISFQNRRAVAYIRNFGSNYSYVPNRAVTIQGKNSYLATKGAVSSGINYQWAQFGTLSYLQNNPKHQFKFIVEELGKGSLRISCPFDAVSYLSVSNPLTSSNDYKWAQFATWQYLQSNIRDQKDPRFTYGQYNNQLQSNYGAYPSYLTPNHDPVDESDWAQFATADYINEDPKRYIKTIYIKDL